MTFTKTTVLSGRSVSKDSSRVNSLIELSILKVSHIIGPWDGVSLLDAGSLKVSLIMGISKEFVGALGGVELMELAGVFF